MVNINRNNKTCITLAETSRQHSCYHTFVSEINWHGNQLGRPVQNIKEGVWEIYVNKKGKVVPVLN
jgi:hypothetical protein